MNKKKTGVQVKKIYTTMKKDGITPEKAMFYLLAYMEEKNAAQIGMDIKIPNGKVFCVTVEINNHSTENINKPKEYISSVI